MKLVETKRDQVVLEYLDRHFYADDALPSGGRARDLPGLDPVLRQRWLTQKRQRSPGPQYSPDRKIGIGVRVKKETKAALQREADGNGIALSALAARVLEAHVASREDPTTEETEGADDAL